MGKNEPLLEKVIRREDGRSVIIACKPGDLPEMMQMKLGERDLQCFFCGIQIPVPEGAPGEHSMCVCQCGTILYVDNNKPEIVGFLQQDIATTPRTIRETAAQNRMVHIERIEDTELFRCVRRVQCEQALMMADGLFDLTAIDKSKLALNRAAEVFCSHMEEWEPEAPLLHRKMMIALCGLSHRWKYGNRVMGSIEIFFQNPAGFPAEWV